MRNAPLNGKTTKTIGKGYYHETDNLGTYQDKKWDACRKVSAGPLGFIFHFLQGERKHGILVPHTRPSNTKGHVMIHRLLIFLGLRRHPLPPIHKSADWRELAKINDLLRQDRKHFPTR